MLGTTGEERSNSEATFSYGLLHIDAPLLVDQQKHSPALCHLEDLPRAMIDRDGWQERVKEIHAVSMS